MYLWDKLASATQNLLDKIENVINKINSQIFGDDLQEITSSDETEIVMYDTSSVLIRKYETLSEKEQQKVDKFISKIDISNFENLITYGSNQNKISTVLTELLLKTFHDIKEFKVDKDITHEEKLKMRLEMEVINEQLTIYKEELEKINKELELSIVALIKVFDRERPRLNIKEIFDVAERIHRKSINRALNEAINRMKVCKAVVETQLKTIDNWETVKQMLSNAIEAYKAIVKEPEIEEKEREFLEEKTKELLQREQVIFGENNSSTKEGEEDKEIKKLAEIKTKLDIYAYTQRDKIEVIRNRIKEIAESEEKAKDKEAIIKELEEIKIRLDIFGYYIQDEDWKTYYETKFEVLTSDINQIDEIPFDIEKLNKEELKYYERIIQRKIEEIRTGRNPELNRAFGTENLKIVIRQIKGILKGDSGTFNIETILKDIMRLRLLLAFDKEFGVEEIVIKKAQGMTEVDESFIEWADNVPIKTIMQIQRNPEYEFYREKMLIASDNPFIKLFQSCNYLQSDTEEKTTHIVPEGIVRIGNTTYYSEQDIYYYNDNYTSIILPSTLKRLKSMAFRSRETKDIEKDTSTNKIEHIEFNDELEEIDDDAFSGIDYGKMIREVLEDAMQIIPEEVPEDRVERIKKAEALKKRIGHYEKYMLEMDELEEKIKIINAQIKNPPVKDEVLIQMDDLYNEFIFYSIRYKIINKYRETPIQDSRYENIKNSIYELKFIRLMFLVKAGHEDAFKYLDKDSEEYKYFVELLRMKVAEFVNESNDSITTAFGMKNKKEAISIIMSLLDKPDVLQDVNVLKLLFAFENGGLETANIQLPKQEVLRARCGRYYLLSRWREKIPLSSIIKMMYDPEYKNYLENGRYYLCKDNPFIKLLELYNYKKTEIDDKKPKTYRFLEGIEWIDGPYYDRFGTYTDTAGIIREGGYTRVVLPSTLKYISGGDYYDTGRSAFSGAENGKIEEIVLNEGLEKIGENAFMNSNISEAHIPQTVRVIDGGAFKYSHLKDLIIPESVVEIGNNAFEETLVEEVTIPASVERMGNYVFSNCKVLKRAEVNAKHMGAGDFSWCNNLKELVITQNVEDVRLDRINCKKVRLYANRIGYREKWIAFDFSKIGTLEIMGTVQEIVGKSYETEVNQIAFRDYNGLLKGYLPHPQKISFYEGENTEPYLEISKEEWKEEIRRATKNQSYQDRHSKDIRNLYESTMNEWEKSDERSRAWHLRYFIDEPSHDLIIKNLYEIKMQKRSRVDPNIRRIFEEYKRRRDGVETECKKAQSNERQEDLQYEMEL